ncbi:AGAP012289-PA-like protein [Anopheles sinensis]|uniref:AGAP012289-PA-like protein n=1 Tax=Anopheles sinensis TaxID=74873 RepID=A0A084WHW5_ANOSI|nr:AGAP012289-PA-like protein [Anopheles sinensis]
MLATNKQPSEEFVPRDYQVEMKNICLTKNTLIFLPTGAGKTHIALMVMKEKSYQLQSSVEEGGKRMFFVANTIALAKQQAQFFSRHMPFNVRLYTSEVNVDAWKEDRWKKEFADVQIFVSTAQILLDVLRHGYLSPVNINLIVFDECHRAVGQHPMHAIMKEMITVSSDMRPRIVGLSGTLLFKELKYAYLVPEELERLENTFNATIATVGNYEKYEHVRSFSTDPNEVVIFYTLPTMLSVGRLCAELAANYVKSLEAVHLSNYKTISLTTLRQGRAKPIKEVQKAVKSFMTQLQALGVFPASLAILGVIVQLELAKRSAECDKARVVMRDAIRFCETIRQMLASAMEGYSVEQQVLQFSSHRVRRLIQFLEGEYKQTDDVKRQSLVFVEQRFTAKVLYHVIKVYFRNMVKEQSLNPIITPEFIVGRNATMEESIEEIITQKQNRKVIENFRKHKLNVLVATNVLEEGIDLQMCNTVIMFDMIKTYVSYMQSKGRARMKTSKYLMMVPETQKSDFLNRIKLYGDISKELQKELVGKTIDRPLPLEQDVRNELLDDIIPPFYTPIGAKLDALSSLQLLNRYCMSMPRDLFTGSNATWERHDGVGGKFYVSVKLPLQSSVRETIYGQTVVGMKLARQSAAFNACKKLYEAGELNDHLLPISSVHKVEELSEKYFQHWKQIEPEKNPRVAGTAKNVRAHKIRYPSETIDCTPRADGEECLVYVLRVKAHFAAGVRYPHVKVLEDLFTSPNNFGILTRKPLPPLAQMQLFVTLGGIRVELVPEPLRVTLASGSGQLTLLQRFHLLIFRDMLKVWKGFTVLDVDPEENGFLIVPLLGSETIDWKLIEQFPYLRPATEASPRVRQQLRFEPERYLHRVIHPWYKHDPDQHYVVVRVREDMTPSTPFPNERFASFEDYFATEHHQMIFRRDDQFLIEVKGISTSLNRLHPGQEADGGSSSRTKHLEFQEILIPELVHNFEFPADYWLKATLLPSALHRIHYLLLAESIRVDLATNANVGQREYSERPQDLRCDLLLNRVDQKLAAKGGHYEDEDDDDDDDDELEEDDEDKERNKLNTEQFRELLVQIHSDASVYDRIEFPWQESEEPIDLERHWDNASRIDIDYYCSFLNKYGGEAKRLAVESNHSLTETNIEKDLAQLELEEAVSEAGSDRVGSSPGVIHVLQLKPESTANVCLQQADILEALTTKSSGDVFNLERFELLGDAFLKFAVSVYILASHDTWHEGYLTTCKGRIVSNRNLLYCAMLYGLPGMIKVYPFDPKNDWVPPLSVVPAPVRQPMVEANESPALLYKLELSEEEIRSGVVKPSTIDRFLPLIEKNEKPYGSTLQSVLQQVNISDKAVADVMEALLGVCVKTVGYERSFRVLAHFGIIPKEADVAQLLRNHQYPIVDYHGPNRLKIDQMLCAPGKIERVLDYEFRNRTYLLQAFTHATYSGNHLTGSYQQLEFLGDAVLDFLVTLYIYERNPSMSPGQLTDLRSALVNNVNLACVLVRYELHRYILSESPMLTTAIDRFVAVQRRKHNRIGDWVRLLCEEGDTPLVEYVDVPKVLGDVFEALIGAVYLDCGKNLDVVWRVCYRLLRDEITNFSLETPIQVVRQLHEHPDANPHFSAPRVEDEVVMVKLTYSLRNQRLKVYGFGKNKEDAKRAAAKIALSRLKE